MRGLNYMIEHKALRSKNAAADDQELVKEPFMENKKKEDWTEEEVRKYNEYLRKEKDIQERKEKIRSQNLTKLNGLKMDIENLKGDLDSKFLKIYKKRLYYDYKICEQELYVLALLRTIEYREEIKNKSLNMTDKYIKSKEEEERINNIKESFKKSKTRFKLKYENIERIYNERNKGNKLIEVEKNLFEFIELNSIDKDFLHKIRADPYFFFERDKIKQIKKYGNKGFKEIKSTLKSVREDDVNCINLKYYVYIYLTFSMIIRETNLKAIQNI